MIINEKEIELISVEKQITAMKSIISTLQKNFVESLSVDLNEMNTLKTEASYDPELDIDKINNAIYRLEKEILEAELLHVQPSIDQLDQLLAKREILKKELIDEVGEDVYYSSMCSSAQECSNYLSDKGIGRYGLMDPNTGNIIHKYFVRTKDGITYLPNLVKYYPIGAIKINILIVPVEITKDDKGWVVKNNETTLLESENFDEVYKLLTK